MKKGIGFSFVTVSAVLTVAAIALYGKSYTINSASYGWLAAALLVDVIGLLMVCIGKKGAWINWIPVVGAALTMMGVMQSVNIMLDAVGYVVAGLYLFSDIQGWVVFMVVGVLAVICDVAAGFASLAK